LNQPVGAPEDKCAVRSQFVVKHDLTAHSVKAGC
jgi:hypothetical protein